MAQLGLRKWGSQLTTIEREKARREQLRREKLTALLNQKIHRAFGLTSSHPVIEEEIESFVLNNKGDFSEIKLKQLKNDIAAKLAPEGITLKTTKPRGLGKTAAKAGLGIVGISETPHQKGDQRMLSRGSKHSMSVKSIASSKHNGQNYRSSQMSNRSTSHRSLAESDEWREIQNFNTLLYLEEQNQEIQREKERQRNMKEELDRQIREKRQREKHERETEMMYEDMQRKIIRESEKKEKLRLENIRRKIQLDKESRDKQILMEIAIRNGESEREKAQEALMVAKLKKELELEKVAHKEHRNELKKQMKDMMSENANSQYLNRVAQQKEKEEDVRIQRDIMHKLDIQQNKEANNAKQRKEKQEIFVDKMANEVYSKINQKHREEEEKIEHYSNEANMKARLEEERKLKRLRREQNDMRDTLARQIKDKRSKEEIDKEVIEEQAKLWQMDRAQFAKIEEEMNKKNQELSKMNSEQLQKQIDDQKNKQKGMDGIEYQLNKTYLKGIRNKKHEIIKEGV